MKEMPTDIKDVADKIKEMKGGDEKNITSTSQEVNGLLMCFQIAIELISGVIVGVGIGYVLDKIFDSKYLMMLTFTLFGFFAGMLNVYRFINSQENKRK